MPRTSMITPEKFTTFGELLRFLRRKADLTQRELSIAVGYSESQISRLEQNERAPEEATLAARFVPALYIEDEPQWVERLLELGVVTRAHAPNAEALQPIAEAKPTPHNLPIQLTSFIGREKEIMEIKRLLSESEGRVRLLTLTGHGGSGKTRLALQAASSLLDDFRDGVWLIEFAALADSALVPQTVVAVLGLKEELGRALLSTLTNHLRSKKILLVLDNCEHLVQASAQLADALLHACSDVHILATSREMLGVAGERALVVPSLSMPDPRESPLVELLSQYEAVRLFAERAAIVKPGFTITDENSIAIEQICQRLDGIPLAIELAAARLRMLPVEQVAERLDDAFRLLTGGSRTALPRHQTLQALIDWGYELLTRTEQVVFRRLAVFAGGWTLEAAEAVCVGEGIKTDEVFDLLAHLLDKSLMLAEEHSKTARYHMLETIRQYALAKLAASGEADAVRRRHAEYYLGLAEAGASWTTSYQPAWFDRMEIEHDNLRAALTWSLSAPGGGELGLRLAAAMTLFWVVRGYWSEGRGWLEGALAYAKIEVVDHTHAWALALRGLGELLSDQGNYAAGQTYFADSLKCYKELGDVSGSAAILHRLGWLARERGDAVTARLRLEESLVLCRELEDQLGLAWGLVTLGEVGVMQEDAAWATALIEESLTLFRHFEETLGIAWCLNHLGHAAQIKGDYVRAKQFHEESLPLFRKLGARSFGIPWAFQGLGETVLAQGDAALAATHLAEALGLFHDLGDRAGTSWCLAALGRVAAVNEEPERAAWLWGAAEALRQSIGARPAPAARATHERLQAEVRRQLGEAMFNVKWAEGQAASVERVIAEALTL
jgi:predicted ATPase